MPISQAYSLMSKDFAKVKYICERFTPSLIYVETLAPFVPALKAVSPKAQIVAKHSKGELTGVIALDALLAAKSGRAVEEAFAELRPHGVAHLAAFGQGRGGLVSSAADDAYEAVWHRGSIR
jgi:feruloyl-CoA synthase